MDVHEAVKSFIEAQNYKGAIDEKGSTAEQNYKRLNEAVNILEQNGVTAPTETDFENILKPAIAAKGKKAGTQAKDKTINRGLNLARKFYHWIQSKGDFQMNDNELTTTAEEEQKGQTAFSPEFAGFAETMMLKKAMYEMEAEKAKGSNQPEGNEAMFDMEASTKKTTGRPKTGRTEKITLYTTAEAMEDLTMLTDAYNTNITELMNKLIDDYRLTQSEQIAWLKKQKQQFNKLFVK